MILMLLTIAVNPVWAADKKSEKNAEEVESVSEKPEPAKVDDKILSPSDVSKQMADIWCEKLAECDGTQDMGPKECRKVLKQSFDQGFKNTAKGQKVEVSQATMSQCNQSIKADTCDSLKTAQKLKGCEFINLLNRS